MSGKTPQVSDAYSFASVTHILRFLMNSSLTLYSLLDVCKRFGVFLSIWDTCTRSEASLDGGYTPTVGPIKA